MRKEATVIIADDNRDKGKIFRLREMSSQQAENWATRLLLCLANHGAEVPQNFFDMSMAGIAVMGVYAITHVPWAEAKPLLDEMMSCVRIQPSANNPQLVRDLIDRGDDGDDIEEVATRIHLKDQVLKLHLGFSVAEGISNLRETLMAQVASGEPTETSAPPSEQ